jgi:ubiquinone/menaquinone biosynthesis C-methylase UbiE
MSELGEFDQFVQDYREIHNKNLKATGYTSRYFAERKIREIADQIKEKNNPFNILDLGCGDGLCSVFFRNYFPNASVCGLDVSKDSVQIAREKKIVGAEFSLYDGSHIPYEDNLFDIIMIANVLHHVTDVKNQIKILTECHRVLKKDGRLFVFEHNPFNPITCKIVNSCPFDKDAVLVNPIQMKKILQGIGFKTTCRFLLFLPEILQRLEFLEKQIGWVPMGGQYYCISTKGF